MHPTQLRQLSSSKTSLSVLDYFKFFKPKQTAQAATHTTPIKDTNQVIQEVQQNQEEIAHVSTVKILGRKNPRYTDPEIISQNLNGFMANPWINTNKSSFVTPSQISTNLSKIFADFKINDTSKPIEDLYLRFKIWKTIQNTFQISIPDSKFTSLATLDQIETYLITNLNPALKTSNKTPFQPDALDFDHSKFQGSNVSFNKFVFESEKKSKYKNLLKKASRLEKKSLDDYVQKEKSI